VGRKSRAKRERQENGEQPVGECMHCGRIRPRTDDHVPPKSLF